jgi:hypothetical protein
MDELVIIFDTSPSTQPTVKSHPWDAGHLLKSTAVSSHRGPSQASGFEEDVALAIPIRKCQNCTIRHKK